MLVTSPERYAMLADTLAQCPDFADVVLTIDEGGEIPPSPRPPCVASLTERSRTRASRGCARDSTVTWREILYNLREYRTSEGRGAPPTETWWPARKAWRAILENHADDVCLAALPLSFDAGSRSSPPHSIVGACP